MLNIYLGEMEDVIYHPPTYFDNQYEDSWIVSEISKKMIKDIDKSDVVGCNLIQSPVLGPIPPRMLSGGVKTLILLANDVSGNIFNISACGDNCAKWILKIAANRDITVNLRHVMDFGDLPFEAKVLNTGDTVHNAYEFVNIAGYYV